MNTEVELLIKKIKENQEILKIELTKNEENTINSCKYLEENINGENSIILKLKTIERKMEKKLIENDITPIVITNELGALSKEDLKNKKTIANTSLPNSIHLLFHPDKICGYEKISVESEIAFQQALENPRFCASIGQSGIKRLVGKKPKCNVVKEGVNEVFTLDYELKIINNKDRILFFELTTINSGRYLVAGAYLEDGLHKKCAAHKTYQVKWNQTEEKNYKMSSQKNTCENQEPELTKYNSKNKTCNRHCFFSSKDKNKSTVIQNVENPIIREEAYPIRNSFD